MFIIDRQINVNFKKGDYVTLITMYITQTKISITYFTLRNNKHDKIIKKYIFDSLLSQGYMHFHAANPYPLPKDEEQKNTAVENTIVKNNDGRDTCFACGAPTESKQGFTDTYQVCTKCGK